LSAPAPGRLPSRDELISIIRQITAEIRDDDVPSLAAAVAFKIMLALLPSLAAAIAIFSMLTDPNDLSRLLDNLAAFAPDAVVRFLQEPLQRLIRDRAAGFAAVAGVAGGLWVASGAAVTLNRALTRAYDLQEQRRFVKARVTALLVTVALLAALIAVFVLVVAGGTIEDRVLRSLPLTGTARGVLDWVSTVGRYLLVTAGLMVLFAFIYWIGPNHGERPRFPWISPGAVVGVIGSLVVSVLFGVYTSTLGSYDTGSVYGPLGSVILFMIWLQLSMLALLLGAEVNQTLRLRAEKRTQEAEVAGFGGELAVPAALVADPAPSGGDAAPAGGGDAAPSGGGDRALFGRTRANRDHDLGAQRQRPNGGHARGTPDATLGSAIVAAVSAVVSLVVVRRRRRRGVKDRGTG
jgi:membrane protein